MMRELCRRSPDVDQFTSVRVSLSGGVEIPAPKGVKEATTMKNS